MTNTTTVLRKGVLAYVGLCGTIIQHSHTRYAKVRASRKAFLSNICIFKQNAK